MKRTWSHCHIATAWPADRCVCGHRPDSDRRAVAEFAGRGRSTCPPSASVTAGTAISVTMRFSDLTFGSDTNLTFRADVVGADRCEDNANGYGLGVDRYMKKVDENPEVRTGTVLAACPPGDYTIEARISTSDDTELASAPRPLHHRRAYF